MKEIVALAIMLILGAYWVWWCQDLAVECLLGLTYGISWMCWHQWFAPVLVDWYIRCARRSQRKATFKEVGLTEEEFVQARNYFESQGVSCRGSKS